MSERKSLPKIQNSKKNQKIISSSDTVIQQIISDNELDLTALNNLIYASACVTTELCGPKIRKVRKNIHKKPAWQEKIYKQINCLRSDIEILKNVSSANNRVRISKTRKLRAKYNIKGESDIAGVIETLKQTIQAKTARIRRFEKRSRFYKDNNMFKNNPKNFYRSIGKTQINVNTPPSQNEIQTFWTKIWAEEKSHNSNAEWIDRQSEALGNVKDQEWKDVSLDDLQFAFRKSSKWKTPGKDKIPNFWLSNLSSTHEKLTTLYNNIILEPDTTPSWLVNGITFLLPKSDETNNPKNYRPITCLTTMYKILTSILTERTYTFLSENDLFPLEQKGCKKGSYGCKDQLLINRMILENCHNNHRNLSVAWIDYKKAFDSIPHSWIEKCLEMYHISPIIRNFLSCSMKHWKTTLILNTCDDSINAGDINIKSGIFQGDALSPILFCLALFPLSSLLNESQSGYKIFDKTINHLLYMDDLKLFAKNDSQLEGLLNIVGQFSKDIKMEFGLDKCAKATFIKGKLHKTSCINLNHSIKIRELEQEEVYKYLGVSEGDGIHHSAMREKIRKECYRRVRAILKTELNSRNRIDAINSLAIPVVTYSFNVINWSVSEIKKVDTKIRKLLTMHRMHHPKADVDRLYLPRKDGGRGMIQLELSLATSTIGVCEYLENTKDWMLKLVLKHERSKKLYSIPKEASKHQRTLGTNTQSSSDEESSGTPTQLAKNAKINAKLEGLKNLTENWEGKALHGKYPARVNDNDVNKTLTHQWLASSGLKSETEGFIIAAQDQCLNTRNYQAHVLKNGADPLCRICNQYNETIDHIVSGCPILAPSEYKNRHDRVGQYIHWGLCKHFNLPHEEHWWEHKPPPVVEGNSVTILWDFSIHTDRTINANRPDIVLKNHSEKTCLLIDMAIPSDNNTSLKTFEKLSKYKDLEIEITKMWHLKTNTVPIIIGALGMISKTAQDYVSLIPGNLSLSEIQKITLMGTSHILRKILSM